eukprot:5824029-Karenia_brevis.AAC.1
MRAVKGFSCKLAFLDEAIKGISGYTLLSHSSIGICLRSSNDRWHGRWCGWGEMEWKDESDESDAFSGNPQ